MPMPRIQFSIDDILKEIPNSSDGAGVDLSLTSTYDEIKNARYEEDDSLSFGIWKRDLKKADWALVEKLSFEALKDQTKSLQIAGWLVESFVVLDGFPGIVRALQALNLFIEYFWQSCFPKNIDGSSDEEYKLRILNWIVETINKKIIFLPLVSEQHSNINIYSYDYAIDLLSKSKRATATDGDILEAARKNNIKTLEEIQKAIKNSEQSYSQTILDSIENIKIAKKQLDETLKKIFPKDADIIFKPVIQTTTKIESIIRANSNQEPVAKEQNQENEEQNETAEKESGTNKEEAEPNKKSDENKETQSKIQRRNELTRDNLYKDLQILAENIKIIDSHGPSYYMLQLVLSWKDKNLIEIIEDLQSGNSEAHKMLKTLQRL